MHVNAVSLAPVVLSLFTSLGLSHPLSLLALHFSILPQRTAQGDVAGLVVEWSRHMGKLGCFNRDLDGLIFDTWNM